MNIKWDLLLKSMSDEELLAFRQHKPVCPSCNEEVTKSVIVESVNAKCPLCNYIGHWRNFYPQLKEFLDRVEDTQNMLDALE